MLLAVVVVVLDTADMEHMEDRKHMEDMEHTEGMMGKMETNTYSQHSLCTLLKQNCKLKAVELNCWVMLPYFVH